MSIKLIAAAAALAATTASVANAEVSYLSLQTDLISSNTLDLGTVRAASAGVVEIYDYRGGEQRELLGSTVVNAGANQDVRVPVLVAPRWDVLAVLTVDGQVVDSMAIDIER